MKVNYFHPGYGGYGDGRRGGHHQRYYGRDGYRPRRADISNTTPLVVVASLRTLRQEASRQPVSKARAGAGERRYGRCGDDPSRGRGNAGASSNGGGGGDAGDSSNGDGGGGGDASSSNDAGGGDACSNTGMCAGWSRAISCGCTYT
ncbi:hypothetical protein ACP4OV_031065 [Aristida adscensionis]